MMLKKLLETNKLYGYSIDAYNGGKGIVIANSEDEARDKIISSYIKHGYNSNEFNNLEVWKVGQENSLFSDSPEVMEIWE